MKYDERKRQKSSCSSENIKLQDICNPAAIQGPERVYFGGTRITAWLAQVKKIPTFDKRNYHALRRPAIRGTAYPVGSMS